MKNAGATYQRLMNKVSVDQIGRIMEVYVDDMVAKTMGDGDHCTIVVTHEKSFLRLGNLTCS